MEIFNYRMENYRNVGLELLHRPSTASDAVGPRRPHRLHRSTPTRVEKKHPVAVECFTYIFYHMQIESAMFH